MKNENTIYEVVERWKLWPQIGDKGIIKGDRFIVDSEYCIREWDISKIDIMKYVVCYNQT